MAILAVAVTVVMIMAFSWGKLIVVNKIRVSCASGNSYVGAFHVLTIKDDSESPFFKFNIISDTTRSSVKPFVE